MCLEAIEKVLDKYEPKMSVLRRACICEAVQITMTSNNRCIAGRFFTQINGATVGGGAGRGGFGKYHGHIRGPIYRSGSRKKSKDKCRGSTGTHGLEKVP